MSWGFCTTSRTTWSKNPLCSDSLTTEPGLLVCQYLRLLTLPAQPRCFWAALWRCVSESLVQIIQTALSPSTTWPRCTPRGGSTRRPRTCTRGRWTSGRGPCLRTTPRWPTRSSTWPCCTSAEWDPSDLWPSTCAAGVSCLWTCVLCRGGWRRRCRCMNCLWTSGKKVLDPNIPVWPQLWSTWLWSTVRWWDHLTGRSLTAVYLPLIGCLTVWCLSLVEETQRGAASVRTRSESVRGQFGPIAPQGRRDPEEPGRAQVTAVSSSTPTSLNLCWN